MSEDTTKNLEEKYSTKPTIETVLDSINSLGHTLNARIDELETNLNSRIDGLETSVNDLKANFNVRLDRLERDIKLVHSMTFGLRADLTELRHQLKLPD
jgi:outer membrane murein-binding lipoprotein Lpp